MSAARGGQILASEATRGLISRALPAGAGLRDLGEHRLKDLPAPERLYNGLYLLGFLIQWQLIATGLVLLAAVTVDSFSRGGASAGSVTRA